MAIDKIGVDAARWRTDDGQLRVACIPVEAERTDLIGAHWARD
jgi:hypothetical protein